ncbi:MAG TPA: hypothetical protein VMS76_07895 [Planctomycetota bacterium]|nr:hypothetical protein [Planctomycetota bacterium]
MRDSARQRERRVGPLVLILPLAFLVGGALYLVKRVPALAPAPPPAITDPGEEVAGFAGELAGAGGSRLEAWLAPLHADPARQALEAAAMRRRLELAHGSPWRLVLRWQPAPAGAPAPALAPFGESGPPGGEAPARDAPAAIGLGPVEVRDELGLALGSLVQAARPGEPGAVADPLRTLFSAPPGCLREGEAVDWILWGRVPQGEARLVGLLPDHAAVDGAPADVESRAFSEATGFAGPLVLRPRAVHRGDLSLPLARLERGTPAGALPSPPASLPANTPPPTPPNAPIGGR